MGARGGADCRAVRRARGVDGDGPRRAAEGRQKKRARGGFCSVSGAHMLLVRPPWKIGAGLLGRLLAPVPAQS